MSVVPRKREAAGRGLDIARSGGHAPNPLVARREALEAIRLRALDDISRSSDEAARLLELAAANPDMAAKPLLEAYGQGASGPMRTLAWWRRNGCRVKKGERAVLLSMFGNAFYSRKQVIGPDPGGIGSRETPPNELPDLGEPYAIAILAARAGVRLRAVYSEPELYSDQAATVVTPAAVPPIPSVDALERALAAVRAYDETAVQCISCDGYGCVLCSCSDDRAPRRVTVKPAATIPPVSQVEETVRVQATAKIGRPVKVRPSLPDTAKAFKRADRLEARAKTVRVQAIRDAMAAGASLQDVGDAVGLSRARIHQLLNGR